MYTEQQELKLSQDNVEEVSKSKLNSEIIQRRQIENTPFYEITTEEERFLILGANRLTDNLNYIPGEMMAGIREPITGEEYIDKNTWTLVMQVAGIAAESIVKNSIPIKGSFPIEKIEYNNPERITNK